MKQALILLGLLAWSVAGAQTLEEDAAATIMVGPLVDSVDATAETALTISQADVRLSKNGGNMAQKNDATACTHDELGMYGCPLNATDTDTAGRLTVTVGEAGTLVWSKTYQVVASGFYDLLDGTESLMTARDAGLLGGIEIAAGGVTNQFTLVLDSGPVNADAWPNGTALAIHDPDGPSDCVVRVVDYSYSAPNGTVVTDDTCTFAISDNDKVRAFAYAPSTAVQLANNDLGTITGTSGAVLDTGAINDDSIGAQTELATAAALATAQSDLTTIKGHTDDIGVAGAGLTEAGGTGDQLTALATQASVDTIDGIVDDILVDTSQIGAAGAGLTEAGGTGDHLTALPYNSAWDTEIESEANDALVALHLDHLLAVDYDPASKPGTGTALLNEVVEDDVGVSRFTANALEQAPSGGGGGGGDATEAKQDQIIALIDTEIAAILADTDEMQQDDVPGLIAALNDLDAAGIRAAIGLASANLDTQLSGLDGKLDTVDSVADAIKIKTDSLTFTEAGEVDANVQSFDGTEVCVTASGLVSTVDTGNCP